MKKNRLLGYVLFALWVLYPLRSYGFDASQFNWGDVSDDFVLGEKSFRGTTQVQRTWPGLLCDGGVQFTASYDGRTDRLDVALGEDGNLTVDGLLSNIVLDLTGGIWSDLSFCTQVALKHRIYADRLYVKAVVSFVDRGENVPPELKVKVTSTWLDRLRFSMWLPEWVEDELTTMVNQQLKKVWTSRLGDQINAKLAKEFKKKFPTP